MLPIVACKLRHRLWLVFPLATPYNNACSSSRVRRVHEQRHEFRTVRRFCGTCGDFIFDFFVVWWFKSSAHAAVQRSRKELNLTEPVNSEIGMRIKGQTPWATIRRQLGYHRRGTPCSKCSSDSVILIYVLNRTRPHRNGSSRWTRPSLSRQSDTRNRPACLED